MKKLLSKKEFETIYKKVPRVCVELVIFKDKKFLLTKRSIYPFKNFWHFPGGGILLREKISEAIQRVAITELGVKVIPEKLLGYFEIPNDGYRHAVSLVFKCKVAGKKEPLALEGSSEVKFFSKPPRKTVPYHKKFLNTYVKK